VVPAVPATVQGSRELLHNCCGGNGRIWVRPSVATEPDHQKALMTHTRATFRNASPPTDTLPWFNSTKAPLGVWLPEDRRLRHTQVHH